MCDFGKNKWPLCDARVTGKRDRMNSNKRENI